MARDYERLPTTLAGLTSLFGAPIGFLFSGGIFLLLSPWLTEAQFFCFRLAAAVPRQCGARERRALRAADDYRNAGLSSDRPACRTFERTGVQRLSPSSARDHRGHAHLSGNVCDLLSDDGLHVIFGNHRPALQPDELSAHATPWRLLLPR